MLTIAIPALNEAANIGSVVRFAKAHPSVREVIVVDDGSTDDTVRLATEAGANVITSTLLGKGPSMRDALAIAQTEFILYLDGDMRRLDASLIDRMLSPLERGADFVKASFARSAGRVTELTARPLLRTFFPELSQFSQPLGGIIAARTELLQRLRFEYDFGVDIGLLIDAHFLGALVVEVDVGTVEHDSKPLASLGNMAMQVSRAILRRAELVGRLQADKLAETMEHERQLGAELDGIASSIDAGGKLALFDMDGTLLKGRFIQALAQRAGFEEALHPLLDNGNLDAATRSQAIAALLKGLPQQTFIDVAKSIPLQEGAVEAVIQLRKMGYRVGIVSDSYYIAAEIIRKRVFADFAVAHVLSFAQGEATGELRVNELFAHSSGCASHVICKRNVLQHLEDFADQPFGHTLMVGDGDNDLCLIKAADAGFAYRTRSPRLSASATPLTDLREISALISRESALLH